MSDSFSTIPFSAIPAFPPTYDYPSTEVEDLLLPKAFVDKTEKKNCCSSKMSSYTTSVVLVITVLALLILGSMGISGSMGGSALCVAICNGLTIYGVSTFTAFGGLAIFTLVGFVICRCCSKRIAHYEREYEQPPMEYLDISCLKHCVLCQSNEIYNIVQEFETQKNRNKQYRVYYACDASKIYIFTSHQSSSSILAKEYSNPHEAASYVKTDLEKNGFTYNEPPTVKRDIDSVAYY